MVDNGRDRTCRTDLVERGIDRFFVVDVKCDAGVLRLALFEMATFGLLAREFTSP